MRCSIVVAQGRAHTLTPAAPLENIHIKALVSSELLRHWVKQILTGLSYVIELWRCMVMQMIREVG